MKEPWANAIYYERVVKNLDNRPFNLSERMTVDETKMG